MKDYLVVWSIHVTAKNPEEAAKQADEIREEYDAKSYEVIEGRNSLNDIPYYANEPKITVDVAELWINPEDDEQDIEPRYH